MNFTRITSPLGIVQQWPLFREGLKELASVSKQEFDETHVMHLLEHMVQMDDKTFIMLATEDNELKSFIVAFDSTPIFQEAKVFTIFALLHRPSNIRVTRKLINSFELWALSNGCQKVHMLTKRYSNSSLKMFSRLGFRRDSLLLTKEI